MGRIADHISKMHPVEIIFRVMIVSVGFLFFAFTAWQAFESIRILATHQKVAAEIKECRVNGSPQARFSTYDCEVKYQSPMGRHSATIDKLLFAYDPGDQVDIYIGTGSNYSVEAGGFVGLWGIPTLLTVFGGMFVGFGVWPHKDKKIRVRRTRPPGNQPPISK